MVMLGVLLVIVGTAIRLFTSHPVSHVTGIGLGVAAAGMAFGLIVLVVFVFTRDGPSGGPGGGVVPPASAPARPAGTGTGGVRQAVPEAAMDSRDAASPHAPAGSRC